MSETPDPASWLPQAHFGFVGNPLPDPKDYDPGDDDSEDNEDAPTPPDVVLALRFDPSSTPLLPTLSFTAASVWEGAQSCAC